MSFHLACHGRNHWQYKDLSSFQLFGGGGGPPKTHLAAYIVFINTLQSSSSPSCWNSQKKGGGVFTYCFSFTLNSQIVLSRFLFLKNNQLHPSYPVYCPLFTSFSKHLLINNVCDYLLKTFYSLFELYILLSYFTDSFFTDIVKFCFKETELGKLPFKHVWKLWFCMNEWLFLYEWMIFEDVEIRPFGGEIIR